MTKHRIFALLYAVALFGGMSAAQDKDRNTQPALSSADRNKVVYVADFAIDQSTFKQDSGGILPGPPKGFPSLFRRKKQDPAREAEKLSTLMSKSVVAELKKMGIAAQTLSSNTPEWTDGLLVTGAFSIADEGSQARRAMLGFGSGASKMEASVMVSQLSQPSQPAYRLYVQASSGKKPGAVITPVPVAMFAKLAMNKNTPEKTVKKLAHQIATELNAQLNRQQDAATD